MYTIKQNGTVSRHSDMASIPNDEGNKDYRKYLAWVAEGNSPEYEPEPDAIVERDNDANGLLRQTKNRVLFKALFKLENRVLALEGRPPVSKADYKLMAKESYFEEIS